MTIYADKYINVRISGTWYGSLGSESGRGYTIDVAEDSETTEDEDAPEDEDEDEEVGTEDDTSDEDEQR